MKFKLHHKTPLPLVLALLVNLVLVIALEVLLVYRFPAQLTDRDLAKIDPQFEGCTIVLDDTAVRERFHIATTRDGNRYLIPARIHPFVYTRCRLYPGKITLLTGEDTSLSMVLGMRPYTLTVYPDFVSSSTGAHTGQQDILITYLGLALALGILELGILEKIRGE